jgi:DNA-binding CsgD family transcriptional regulator
LDYGDKLSRIEALWEFLIDPFPIMFGETWDIVSPRQKQIIRLHILSNMSYREVVLNLGIAYSTVKNTASDGIRKLNINGGAGALRREFYKQLLLKVSEVVLDG